MRDIWLLRLRALLACAQSDDAAYRQFADHYRATARSLGFEGHIAWAEESHDRGGIGVLIVWYRTAAQREVLFGVRCGGVDSGEIR